MEFVRSLVSIASRSYDFRDAPLLVFPSHHALRCLGALALLDKDKAASDTVGKWETLRNLQVPHAHKRLMVSKHAALLTFANPTHIQVFEGFRLIGIRQGTIENNPWM